MSDTLLRLENVSTAENDQKRLVLHLKCGKEIFLLTLTGLYKYVHIVCVMNT